MAESDRRAGPRNEVALPVEFETRTAPRQSGGCANLSLGGMFVRTPNPPERGTRLRLYLWLLGEDHEIAIDAIVRWVKPDGMGVQFHRLSQEATYALMKCLDLSARAGADIHRWT